MPAGEKGRERLDGVQLPQGWGGRREHCGGVRDSVGRSWALPERVQTLPLLRGSDDGALGFGPRHLCPTLQDRGIIPAL